MKIEGITLKNFTALNNSEKLMVLEWRNHDDVKKWMYTNENIKIENHLNFIENLKKNTTKQYFMAIKDAQKIGVLYFTNIDKNLGECNFGIYSNPFKNINGVGSMLTAVGIKYAYYNLNVSKIKLEVFEENIKALNLYKKYYFKKYGEKYLYGKKVICMKLNKNI